MNPVELDAYLTSEIAAFPCKTTLLMTDMKTGETLHAVEPETQCVSASTIKVPILLCALEEVRQGRRSLTDMLNLPTDQILPDTQVFERNLPAYSLWELLYWMIVESDNTATNRMIELLGYDAVNSYTNRILGLKNTQCNRKMLDWDAIRAGRNNYTSAADQGRMYALLYRGEILDAEQREVALDMLRRQRSMDSFLRYIPDAVTLAHKTGGLDYLDHDAGIFYLPSRDYYLGIFTWDGPSPEGDTRQKQFIGRLSKAVYDTYK
ncbi:MAG: serine hydrolase [Clostridia bacterium]|nr:serine hydrolase [Clostridia bacterium]